MKKMKSKLLMIICYIGIAVGAMFVVGGISSYEVGQMDIVECLLRCAAGFGLIGIFYTIAHVHLIRQIRRRRYRKTKEERIQGENQDMHSSKKPLQLYTINK